MGKFPIFCRNAANEEEAWMGWMGGGGGGVTGCQVSEGTNRISR